MSQNERHFNIFNTGAEDFVTPGKQLGYIAAAKPDETAIIYISPEKKESRMTWRELEELSNRMAWYFLSQNIGSGDSVVAALPNIPSHIALAFAIWKTGACYVPVSSRSPMKAMAEICQSVKPALVVTNGTKPAGFHAMSTAQLREECEAFSPEMPEDRLAVPNIANLSGGTTGKLKIIQQDMPAGIDDGALRSWFQVSGMEFSQRQLLAGPLFHGAPHTAAFDGLYSGNTVILSASLSAESVVELIEKYKVEFVQMVPTLMERIIRLPGISRESFSSLKALCHTGGACSQDLKLRWMELMEPEKIYEMYSMTECIGMTSIRGDDWLRHKGSVGRPLCGGISIRDEQGRELPAGEVGEIFMYWGGNGPAVEYKNCPQLQTDEQGYRSVGDMGYVDGDGYLYFADRRSDMIVTGGENVFAAEVETVLKKHSGVRDAVVVGLPDKEWGHRIHAIVETERPVTQKELIRFALNYLPPYKLPKSFEFVDSIPHNESGKVLRGELVKESIAKGF